MPKQNWGFKRRQSTNSLSGDVQGLLQVSAFTTPQLDSDPLSTLTFNDLPPLSSFALLFEPDPMPANTYCLLEHILILLDCKSLHLRNFILLLFIITPPVPSPVPPILLQVSQIRKQPGLAPGSLSRARFTFKQECWKKKIGSQSKLLSQVVVKVDAIVEGIAGSLWEMYVPYSSLT